MLFDGVPFATVLNELMDRAPKMEGRD